MQNPKCKSTVTFDGDLVHFTCEDGTFSGGGADFLTSEQFTNALETAWTQEAADEWEEHPVQNRVAFTFRRCEFRKTTVPFCSPILDVKAYSLSFEDCTFDGCPLFTDDFENEEEFEKYSFEDCTFSNCGTVGFIERGGFQQCGIAFKGCSHIGERVTSVWQHPPTPQLQSVH